MNSRVGQSEPILGDGAINPVLTDPVDFGRGLDLSERPNEDGFAYSGLAVPFDNSLLIPRHEWQGKIEELEQSNSQISDLIRYEKMPTLNQGSTNYCWANAPVACMQIRRLQQNQPTVRLSPASVAAPIKRFRNVGGWGSDAIKYIQRSGIAPVDKWPANAIDRRFQTQATQQTALRYRVREWVECRPRNLDQAVSLLLRGIPLAGGFNWWRHEVTLCDAIWLDGEVAIRIWNSWGSRWGQNGFGILRGSKMLADDLIGLYSARAA